MSNTKPFTPEKSYVYIDTETVKWTFPFFRDVVLHEALFYFNGTSHMAANALQQLQQRVTKVKTSELLEKLKKNREKHIAEFNEAVAGYKAALKAEATKVFADAKAKLEINENDFWIKLAAMTDADIPKQKDTHLVVEQGWVRLPVPRSFADQYDAAITIAQWNVEETMELSYEEVVCFIQDKWDWKQDFAKVHARYSRAG